MNKIRLIALVLAIIIVSVSLCSCRSLDMKKSETAIYTDDTKTEILFRDHLYHWLDSGDLTYVFYTGGTDYNDYRVTEKDVPILLSGWYGSYMGMSDDETILACGNSSMHDFGEMVYDEATGQDADHSALYGIYGNETAFYVREDKYDDIKATVESEKLDHYYFNYMDMSDYYYEYDSWDDLNSNISKDVLLDDTATDAIERAMKSGKTEEFVIHDGKQFVDDHNIKRIIPLQKCDKDMILTEAKGTSCYLVERLNKDYKYYATEGCTPDGKCVLHEIDKESYDAIEKYFEDYPYACQSSDYLFPYAW